MSRLRRRLLAVSDQGSYGDHDDGVRGATGSFMVKLEVRMICELTGIAVAKGWSTVTVDVSIAPAGVNKVSIFPDFMETATGRTYLIDDVRSRWRLLLSRR